MPLKSAAQPDPDRAQTRVVCVDDNAGMIVALGLMISQESSLVCVGELPSADALMELVRGMEAKPHVVIIDARMVGVDPFRVMRELASTFPGVRSIVYTGYEDPRVRRRARAAGAWGCIAKQEAPDAILHAVREVAAGRPAWLSERPSPRGVRVKDGGPLRLYEFILANIDPIMAEWESFASSIWPHPAHDETAGRDEMRDHALEILRALAADMKAFQTAEEESEKAEGRGPSGSGLASVDGAARVHGAARTSSGFHLHAVIAEYRALRASVLRQWRAGNPRPNLRDIDDITRFNESIDQSLASAVDGFTIEAERAREALRESEDRFRVLSDHILQLAWIADAERRMDWFNQRWLDYTGTTLEDNLGTGWKAVHHPAHLGRVADKLERHLREGLDWEDVFPLRGKDGSYRWFLSRMKVIRDEQGRVARFFGTNTDITEQRELEQELRGYRDELEKRVEERTQALAAAHANLRRVERMASMGTLAAGLGHDLANLMMPLGVRLEALASEPLSASAREDLEGIAGSLRYLRALSAGLRHMAADPTAPPPAEGLDLAEWWVEAHGMIKGCLPRHVVLAADIPPGLPRVRESRAGLTQAVFNLVQNAGEVLAQARPGRVRVAAVLASTRHLGGVELSVSDNGPGMAPEVAARCFEPYFSTKERAVSTGMGLALVRGTAEQAGGMVEVVSTPGGGTTFTLYFPPVDGPAAGGACARSDASP